jgi:hypothetical protein
MRPYCELGTSQPSSIGAGWNPGKSGFTSVMWGFGAVKAIAAGEPVRPTCARRFGSGV